MQDHQKEPSCGGTASEPRDEIAQLDATAQADLVRRGELHARELIERSCRRVEELDGVLGAVPIRLFEAALATRGAPRGPFAGVPFLLKDVGARQQGIPYYAANRALRAVDHRASADTPLGARFRELGLVTIGKSNTPEFGLQSNTWPLTYGPTHNPWDLARAAGGSSGGACAAVAAGLVPVAHASDGAGSIRIPAAWCGLIGLKPTRDCVEWRHAGKRRPEVEFVVARSLRDTAAFLDLLRPHEARSRAPAPFTRALSRSPERLRIGSCTRAPDGSQVTRACVDAVERAAHQLATHGHDVRETAPDPLFEYQERAVYGGCLGWIGYRECLADLAERLGRPVRRDDVEPFLWELADMSVGAMDIEVALAWLRGWEQRVLAWFERFDLLLTPTVHEPAPLLSTLDPTRLSPLALLERMLPHMAFTEPWNATGQPALSLPLGWTREGLPIGVQLIAGAGGEPTLFSVAALLLEHAPAPPRAPAVHA